MDTGGDDGEDREEDEEDELDEGEEAEDEENIGAAEEDDDKEEKDRPGVLVVFIGSKLSRVTELWLCAKYDTQFLLFFHIPPPPPLITHLTQVHT